MKQVIDFLQELKSNNNREWFMAHKKDYLTAQEHFNKMAEDLLHRIAAFDPTVSNLEIKDCIYRIYRDVRFSKDKSPYKTHIGTFICRGGKKSGFAGYYFQVGVDEDYGVPGHFLAVGNYCYDPKAVKVLREDISGSDEFASIISKAKTNGFYVDESQKLKNVPREFSSNTQNSEYLKLKAYCLMLPVDDKLVLSDNCGAMIAEKCESAKSFIDFINRGIEYANGHTSY